MLYAHIQKLRNPTLARRSAFTDRIREVAMPLALMRICEKFIMSGTKLYAGIVLGLAVTSLLAQAQAESPKEVMLRQAAGSSKNEGHVSTRRQTLVFQTHSEPASIGVTSLSGTQLPFTGHHGYGCLPPYCRRSALNVGLSAEDRPESETLRARAYDPRRPFAALGPKV